MGEAKFVSGSPMRHIAVMTSTASIGLMALFLVDLVDIYFLSLLDKVEITAGVGFAGTLLFFTTSISIGIAIAMAALVSRSVGARKWRRARRHAINVLVYGILIAFTAAGLIYANMDAILSLMGAKGETAEMAKAYLRIVLPSMPFMSAGMAFSGILRAIGDAKRAMMLTLVGAAANAILDPILIFGLDMGIEGAAWATVFGRGSIFFTGLYSAMIVHKMIGRFHLRAFWVDTKTITKIAFPTMITNIATPFATAYLQRIISDYGDQVVAGFSIMSRLQPVLFCGIFALSGAVGPILGQNWGAGLKDRVEQTYADSIKFTFLYTLIASMILFLSQNVIVDAFKAEGETALIITFTCTWLTWSFFFTGAQFVANATFNNLGKPSYSTYFNVGKATIGTIPFVLVGAQIAGALGAFTGQAIGAVFFGIAAIMVAKNHVKKLFERA